MVRAGLGILGEGVGVFTHSWCGSRDGCADMEVFKHSPPDCWRHLGYKAPDGAPEVTSDSLEIWVSGGHRLHKDDWWKNDRRVGIWWKQDWGPGWASGIFSDLANGKG